MKNQHLSKFLVLLGSVLISAAVFADDNTPDVTFDAKLGYLNDSNVGIADLDANSGSADSASSYALALKASLPVSRRLSARAGYDYNATNYQNLSQFDLGLQHLFAELTWKPAWFDTSINAEAFTATLGGEDYLDLRQFTPSISRLVANTVYLRGAYTRADKNYAALPGRDASNDSYRADVYLLLDAMDRYIAVGLQGGKETAADPTFDYGSLRWNMTYGHRFALVARELQLKASVSYEGRDYVLADATIGDVRRDQRLRLRVGADWQVFKHLSVATFIEQTDIRSNLESAALDKTLFEISANATF